jgi:hypothetical protein
VILGASAAPTQLVVPIAPTAVTLFGPRGVCLLAESRPLWVADTGHHRLLGWRQRPTQDNQAADWVIGQPDCHHEGQNAKGKPGRTTLNVPTGICACGDGLAVTDAWNHRVLLWRQRPEASNVPADIVLGQADFTQTEANRGSFEAASDRLNWCYGIFYRQGKLFVADTGNRRVLIWYQLPKENGQPADVVLGQAEMQSRDENGGGTPTAASLRWGHSITVWQGNLVISDAGNNRLMIWDGIPTEHNTPCAVVLGQREFDQVDINQGNYFPNASSLNMPYGVSVAGDWLIAADTANSRLLGWRYPGDLKLLKSGIPTAGLAAQNNAQSKSENRCYGSATRDSLC